MSTQYRTSRAVRSDLSSRNNSGVLGLIVVVVLIAIIAVFVAGYVLPAVDSGIKNVCSDLPVMLAETAASLCK